MHRALRFSRQLSGRCSLYQNVSTWSALTTAFNCRPSSKHFLTSPVSNETVGVHNSMTQSFAEGLFEIPELKKAEGFEILKESVTADTDRLIAESCSDNRSRKMVEIFDELSDSLCKVADVAEFIRIAHPRESFSEAARDASMYVSGIVEKLNTHRQFYKALKHVSDNGDIVPTTEVDEHVAKLFLFDFELSGIHLEESNRKHVLELNDSILTDSQYFMKYSVYSQMVPKDLLPQNVRHLFSVEGNNVIVNGLYADSPNSLARETAYKIFLLPSKKQSYYLDRLLLSRLELAQVCGFPTFSHRALKGCTAGSPEMVLEFLDMLTDKLRPRAEADFKVMAEMKKAEGISSQPIAPWDTPYYTQKAKKEWLRMAASEFSPFFSLGGCMEGLNLLVNALFGIHLQPVELQPGEGWTSDLYKLEVIHETEGVLGHIYCDFYERSGKPNQDCHYTIRGGKVLPDGSYQNPVVVLMLNFPVPRWSSPSLLTPGMVDNLFHEMGHALHSMLARTTYQHVTGTRCSTDFAEVPSVLMEYFASDPRVLRLFARHFQTQEPLPDEMLTRLCASKQLFSASDMQLQVFYSALDQRYHGASPLGPTGNTTDVLATVQKQYYTLPYVENTAWQLRFSHLVGYGAKYYSYLMSRAIASWIWQQCFEADPLSRSQGERYRRECLAHGGGKPPQQLVCDFLQRQVTASQLTSSLLQDLDSKNEQIEVARRGLSI